MKGKLYLCPTPIREGAVYGSQETRFNLSNTCSVPVLGSVTVLLRLKQTSWDP